MYTDKNPPSPKKNILDFVSDFKEHLQKAWVCTCKSLTLAQIAMKGQFDCKSVACTYQPGDKVLALLPMAPVARFSGPYQIEKKLSDMNYVLSTPGEGRNECVILIC